eukprot:365808-Chlamydomonas_euryale.AAC.16
MEYGHGRPGAWQIVLHVPPGTSKALAWWGGCQSLVTNRATRSFSVISRSKEWTALCHMQ